MSGLNADSDGMAFSHVERVRFGHLDAMGHLNNVELLRFFETARIAFLQSLDPAHAPDRRAPFGFIFAECHVNYRAPAFFDDDLRTFVAAREPARSSVTLDFRMVRDSDAVLVADGYGVLVGYDHQAGRAQPLPDAVRDRLSRARTATSAG